MCIIFAFEFNKYSRCSINGGSACFSYHVCWRWMHLWCSLTDMVITVRMNMCDQRIFFVIRRRNFSFWFFNPGVFWLFGCFQHQVQQNFNTTVDKQLLNKFLNVLAPYLWAQHIKHNCQTKSAPNKHTFLFTCTVCYPIFWFSERLPLILRDY